jgi:hypothetical protein
MSERGLHIARRFASVLLLVSMGPASGCETPVPRCVPGSVQSCACSTGMGRQTCLETGTFGPCGECAPEADAAAEADAGVVIDAGPVDANVPAVGEPCTPPYQDDRTMPSPGVCVGELAIDCGPDGRYAVYRTCGPEEECVLVPYRSGRGGASSTWATCRPRGAEACSLEDSPSCVGPSRLRRCETLLRALDPFVPDAFLNADQGFLIERDCAADELCESGACFVDAAPCTRDERTCEGDLVRYCTAGFRPYRADCADVTPGAVCRPASACGAFGATCVIPDYARCPREEGVRCTPDGRGVRDCGSFGCAGDTECSCYEVDTPCGSDERCVDDPIRGALCVPDVDCSAGTFCEGDDAVVCVGGVPSHRLDCGIWGMRCEGSPGVAGCTTGEPCAGDAQTCDGAAVVACCEDGQVSTGFRTLPCAVGRRVRIDCNLPAGPPSVPTYRCEAGWCVP